MGLSQLVRRYFVPAALVVGMLGCSSEKDPCRDGRIYQEGIGCVDEAPSYDAGSSIDTFMAKDASVPPQEDTFVAKDTYVAPKEDTFIAKDTFVPKPDTNCDKMEYFADSDGDGYGNSKDSKFLCGPTSHYITEKGGDCNDKDKFVNPNVKEECNGIDDDCDGKTDLLYKACKTDCGNGKEYCLSGSWLDCDAPKSCSTNVLGDVNCDGKVTSTDSLLIGQYISGFFTEFKTQNGSICASGKKSADVNCDGSVDIDDVNLVMSYTVGKINTLECSVDVLKLGDVNCDGDINIQDTLAVVDYVTGTFTEFKKVNGKVCSTGKQAADVNCDNAIDIDDVNAITDYILGGPSFFPGCEERIAMVCEDKQLWSFSPDGKSKKLIELFSSKISHPSWSYDHQNIVAKGSAGSVPVVFIRNFSTKKSETIANNCGSPDWSSLDQIAMACSGNIYVVDSKGKNKKQLTFNDNNNSPSWNKAGTQILYHRLEYPSTKNTGIHLLNVKTGSDVLIKNQPSPHCYTPDWHPSLFKLAMACSFKNDIAGPFGIYVVNTNGVGLNLLTSKNSSSENLNPSWSPNGNAIAYKGGGKSGVMVLDIATGVSTQLEPLCDFPAFSH